MSYEKLFLGDAASVYCQPIIRTRQVINLDSGLLNYFLEQRPKARLG